MRINKIDLSSISENTGKLSETVSKNCDFCGKIVTLYPEIREMCERLSGDGFYCQFCLRHGHNFRTGKHVLAMSFRAIFGYYYHDLYRHPPRTISYSEIQDLIDLHVLAGLTNPVFCYDPESYLWFVSFHRVGIGNKLMVIDSVCKTVVNILTCFNLQKHVYGFNSSALYAKYERAIMKFHAFRQRPVDRKICIPTLINCGQLLNRNGNAGKTEGFVPSDFVLR